MVSRRQGDGVGTMKGKRGRDVLSVQSLIKVQLYLTWRSCLCLIRVLTENQRTFLTHFYKKSNTEMHNP